MAKNIIITGTSSGIGFELVKIFANNGHNVLALSRNIQPTIDINLPNITHKKDKNVILIIHLL